MRVSYIPAGVFHVSCPGSYHVSTHFRAIEGFSLTSQSWLCLGVLCVCTVIVATADSRGFAGFLEVFSWNGLPHLIKHLKRFGWPLLWPFQCEDLEVRICCRGGPFLETEI